MVRIVIPDDAPPVLGPSRAWQALSGQPGVEYYDTLPGSTERLIERIAEAEVVLNIRSSSRFTTDVLAACPRLRLLSIWGTGTDNVDLEAAASRGITVTNTPAVSAASVAEHALALLLAAARRIPQADRQTRQGDWPRGRMTRMYGKTAGVIGLGAIGRHFAGLAAGIGMRVVAWTMHPDSHLGFDLRPLDDLLQTSDAVSLHLRLSEETRGVLGRRELGLLKPGAILVNTARGPLVDEAALLEALRANRIAAGLDVFDTEPLPAGHPLTALENVVLTPHLAGVTAEALEAGLQMAIDNISAFLSGRPNHVVTAVRG